jgi:hypothetical protein
MRLLLLPLRSDPLVTENESKFNEAIKTLTDAQKDALEQFIANINKKTSRK